jgi:transposase
MAYIKGDRNQLTFLPPAIEDYIAKDDPVRAYDAFVEVLDFNRLDITIDENLSGANPYWPKAMLKLFVYGYSYGIRSSRKLERACCHNLSFIWLTEGLKPDYRTIARFRSDNKEALKNVLKQCIKMCIRLNLIEGNTLFVDSTKIKANASLKNTWTEKDCQEYLEKISKNIEDIIAESEHIDEQEEDFGSLVKLNEKLQNQEALAAKVKEIVDELKTSGKSHVNTTDADSLKGKGDRGTKMYHNVQITVDEKNGLIVNTDIVSQANDANQLSKQIKQAKEVLEKPPKVACADSGYFSLQDLKELPQRTKAIMPTQIQAQKEKQQYPIKPFNKEEFKYNEANDTYMCPENKLLHRKKQLPFNKTNSLVYQAERKDCRLCQHFGVCTTSKAGRKIVRMKDEQIKEKLEAIYKSKKGQHIYKLRKQKAELPFAHIKHNLGLRQFFLRGRKGTNAEFALCATSYNLTRMMAIVGVIALKTAFVGV